MTDQADEKARFSGIRKDNGEIVRGDLSSDGKGHYWIIGNVMEAGEDCFEMEVVRKWPENFDQKASKIILREVHRRHGEDVVVATDDSEANQIAANKGKKVIRVNEGIFKIAAGAHDANRLQSSKEFIKTRDCFEKVIIEGKYDAEIVELQHLLDIVEVAADLHVFENNQSQSATLGSAMFDLANKMREVWLNEVLFLPGNRKRRLSTLIHEAAHIKSKASDGTICFEEALDDLGGRLALYCLDHKKEEAQ